MAALQKKVAKRDGFRTHLANVIGRLEGALSDSTVSHADLLGLRSSLSSALEQLNAVDDEVIALLKPEEVATYVLECIKVLEPTHKLQAELMLKLETFTLGSSEKGSVTGSVTGQHCKLPSLSFLHLRVIPCTGRVSGISSVLQFMRMII